MSDFPIDGIKPIPSDAPPSSKSSDTPPRQNKNAQVNLIVAGLEKTYSGAAMGLALVSPADAQIIAGNAHQLAESWRGLLESNPRVRAQFMKMIETSGWSTVIFTHLMVLGPIFQNHKSSFEHLTRKNDAKLRSNRVAQPTPSSTV